MMTHVQKKADNCSFVLFGVTGDLTHRLVIPALYNLAAGNLLPENFCLVGVARKGMSSAQLTDSLMKGLRQYATRKIDDAVAKQLFSNVTCIEADNKDSSRKSKPSARPAATGCSIWRRRRARSCRLPSNSAAPAC
jgi:glucose-6-phosphate 1-dehydrogenase